jgi:hypothetical protein
MARKRLWFIGLFLPAFLGIMYAVQYAGHGDISYTGFLKGADYVYFHNGGRVIAEGNVYSPSHFQYHLTSDYDTRLFQRNLRPIHPPTMLYLYVPLSLLPYFSSLAIATLLVYLILLFAVGLLLRTNPDLKRSWVFIVFVSVCFPSVPATILTGHPSTLWILFLAGGYYLRKRNLPFAAGLVLSLLSLKPNYYCLVGAVLVLAAEFEVAAGMLAGAVLTVIVSGIWDDFRLWKEWAPIALTYRDFLQFGGGLARQHTTRTFFQLFHRDGEMGNYLSAAGLVIGALSLFFPAIYKFRAKKAFDPDIFWAIVPVAVALANPHMYDYDLCILLLPMIIIVGKAIRMGFSETQVLLALFIAVGLPAAASVVSPYTHFQLSVPFLWWLMLKLTLPFPPSGSAIRSLCGRLPVSLPVVGSMLYRTQRVRKPLRAEVPRGGGDSTDHRLRVPR